MGNDAAAADETFGFTFAFVLCRSVLSPHITINTSSNGPLLEAHEAPAAPEAPGMQSQHTQAN